VTRSPGRMPCAVMTLVALALSGCTVPGQRSQAQDPLVAALQPPYSAHSVDAVVQALAEVGVAVYASSGDSSPIRAVRSPEVPLKFLGWQVRDLALDVTTSGAGLSGDDLDRIAPVQAGYVPTSYLVAAYVKSGSTAGARLARALLGNQDWAHPSVISFPILVLVFLLADTARAEEEGLPTPSGAALTSDVRTTRTISVSSLCSALANWEDEVFGTLFNLLTVPPSSNAVLNFLGGLWNAGIGLVEQTLKQAISALTASAVTTIRLIITVVAVAAEAVSFLQNVKITLTANPIVNRYSNNPGTVTATLGDPDGADWPQALQDCLAAFGVQLPSLNGVNHDPVSWTAIPTPGSAAMVTNQQMRMDGRNTARLSYVTGFEEPSCSQRPDDLLQVDVTVHRVEVDNLKQFLLDFFNGQIGRLPSMITGIIGPKLDELLVGALDKLAPLADLHDRRFVRIEHTVLPQSACTTPTPSESPTPIAISSCDQLVHPGETIEPVTMPYSRVRPDGTFVLTCPIGDPTSPSFEGVVGYARYPSAADAHRLMVAAGAAGAPLTGIGDEALMVPTCQQLAGQSATDASCAVSRLCNQIVWVEVVGQDSIGLLRLIVSRIPQECVLNPALASSPTSVPTPS
jgi:hypothetical protein